MLGQGARQRMLQTAVTDTTSGIGMEIASDKEETKRILESAHVPVPEGNLIYTTKGLEETIEDIGYPVVLKPYNGNHGRGITTNIKTIEDARNAFAIAKKVSNAVIVERFIEGADYRILVINYKFVAAAKRIPAMICGDGRSTIVELIEQINRSPYRGDGHE